ncbi:MAG: acetyltransferase [Chthonomonadaceae bacterium]|nr:acetyltransferase [Chthonomonadaceae bacterium]
MRTQHGAYELDDDITRIDFVRVHSWLTTSYWSPGIALDKVQRAAEGSSLVVGVYQRSERENEPGQQVGYMRVISDKATFAWIADVFVDEAHRGQKIASAMVRFALAHPEHQGLRRWVLATLDAHPVYAGVGFIPLPEPARWMIHLPEAI